MAKYWTRSWNPMIGCSPISEGCRNCFVKRWAKRFGFNFQPHLIQSAFDKPLSWRKPEIIFTGLMTDIFHEFWIDNQIGCLFNVMEKANWHKYLICTKRPERMAGILFGWKYLVHTGHFSAGNHIWVGVSIENQRVLAERIDFISKINVPKFWLSFEPLLSPVIIPDFFWKEIDFIAIGCDTGGQHQRRPCKIEWVRDIVQSAKANHVKVFVKQLEITKRGSSKVSHNPEEWPEDLRIRQMI